MFNQPENEAEYQVLYAPHGKLRSATKLNQPFVDCFMQISQLRASIFITDAAGQDLHNLDQGMERVFGTAPEDGITQFTQEVTIAQTPKLLVARKTMLPDHYSIYLLDDNLPLKELSRLTNSALRLVLRREKIAFLPRFRVHNIGNSERIITYEAPSSVEPGHYLAGRIFLSLAGNRLILPNIKQP